MQALSGFSQLGHAGDGAAQTSAQVLEFLPASQNKEVQFPSAGR